MTTPNRTDTALPTVTAASPFRVIIVDDSALMRRLIGRLFDGRPEFTIVGQAENGERAIEVVRTTPADVVILDIEMPVMDGLTAIPRIKAIDPALQIVMASTLTHKNAEISLRAMSLGATDYIAKPSGLEAETRTDFKVELLEKVKALSLLARRKGVRGIATTRAAAPTTADAAKKPALRPFSPFAPAVIAIGSSTGGPEALLKVVAALGPGLDQPVMITQHMPPVFTSILANNLTRQCGVECVEAKDGMPMLPGRYYVAPGDYHMLASGTADKPVIITRQGERENYCRPAVDPMLRSLVEIFGKRILTVILTGMGQDGCKGSAAVTAAGGTVIAQDEATSVVWGMPGAVATAGLCSNILPLAMIGGEARRLAKKG